MNKSLNEVIRVWKSYGRSEKKTLLTLYLKYPGLQPLDDYLDFEDVNVIRKIVEETE